MTREELLTMLAKRRERGTSLQWAEFTSAVSSISPDVRLELLGMINSGNAEALGKSLMQIAQRKRHELSRAAVDAMAADDRFTVDELIGLLS